MAQRPQRPHSVERRHRPLPQDRRRLERNHSPYGRNRQSDRSPRGLARRFHNVEELSENGLAVSLLTYIPQGAGSDDFAKVPQSTSSAGSSSSDFNDPSTRRLRQGRQVKSPRSG